MQRLALIVMGILIVFSGKIGAEPVRYSLEDLLVIASRENPELAAMRWQIRMAEGRKRQAGLYPNPSFMLEQDDVTFRGGREGAGTTIGKFTQPIVIGGRLKSDIRRSTSEVHAANYAVKMRQRSLFRQIEILVFEINYHTAHYQLQMELFSIAEEALSIAEDHLQSGDIHEYDRLRARNRVDRIALEATRIFAERLYLVQRLSELLGGTPIRAEYVEIDLIKAMVPNLTNYELGKVIVENPEYQYLHARLNALAHQNESFRRQNIPDIKVSVGAGYDNAMEEAVGSVGIEIPLPLFSRNQGNIQATKAEMEMVQNQIRNLELRLTRSLLETRQQLNEFDSFVRDFEDRILPDAKRAHDNAFDKFRNGEIPYMDYIMIQDNFFQAENDYKESIFLLNRTVAEMRFLRGLYPDIDTEGFDYLDR